MLFLFVDYISILSRGSLDYVALEAIVFIYKSYRFLFINFLYL